MQRLSHVIISRSGIPNSGRGRRETCFLLRLLPIYIALYLCHATTSTPALSSDRPEARYPPSDSETRPRTPHFTPCLPNRKKTQLTSRKRVEFSSVQVWIRNRDDADAEKHEKGNKDIRDPGTSNILLRFDLSDFGIYITYICTT
jgi:hypothetical protein